jgi:hypothetical protein
MACEYWITTRGYSKLDLLIGLFGVAKKDLEL